MTPATDGGKRVDVLGSGLVLGTSIVGGGSVVYAAFELIQAQPDRAFRLLQSWGPGFLLALFIAWSLSRIVNRAIDVAEKVGGRVALSLENVATEQGKQALAQQAAADKDDRQLQEMQTLTALTAQRSEKTYAMLQSYHEDMQETLRRIEQKFDNRIAGEEQSKT